MFILIRKRPINLNDFAFSLSHIDDIPKTLESYSPVRRKVYDVVSHYKFDLVIAVIIGLNVVFMAIEHNNMSNVSQHILVI